MPKSRAIALLAAAALPLSALADSGIPITGRVFTDVYVPTRDTSTSTYRQVSASAWLQGDPKLGDYGSARFILTSDAIENNTVSAIGGTTGRQVRLGLREAYLSYARSGFELRLGQQILPWGKSDAINPTDFLTAKDFTFFNPDEEVRRTGSTSIWLSYTPFSGNSAWNLTAVVTPIAPLSKLLVPPSAVPKGVLLSSTPTTPPQTLGNAETALKVTYAASSWDASISAFRGLNHIPELAVSSVTTTATGTPIAFTLTQTHHRLKALGADFSLTWGKWVLRGESAYLWTENDDGTNPLIQPSHWDSVAGVERPLGDDFRIQVQYVHRYFPRYQGAGTVTASDVATTQAYQSIARANALLLAYQDQVRPGATLRVSYTNESHGIDAEVFLLGNFVGGDYLIRPKASYAWTDGFKTTLGLDWYGGPEDRPMGSMAVFNSVFLEGKYSF